MSTFDSVKDFIDSIEREDRRAFAWFLWGHSIMEWAERQAAKPSAICHPRWVNTGKGTDWPDISRTVQEVLLYDLCLLYQRESLSSSLYHRHVSKQRHKVERRRETLDMQGGPRRPRDSQRSKLYAAEDVLNAHVQTRWGEGSVSEMQTWLDKLTGSAWFQRRWPSLKAGRIEVLDGAGHRRATAYSGWRGRAIALPLWARKEWVMLHELAHHCADAEWGTYNVAAHGREFARTYVQLVNHVMGKNAGDDLKASFKEHRVKYSKPRRLSSEQKQAAAERLAAARAR